MPFGMGLTLYSVFFGIQKFIGEKDINIEDKNFNNYTLVLIIKVVMIIIFEIFCSS